MFTITTTMNNNSINNAATTSDMNHHQTPTKNINVVSLSSCDNIKIISTSTSSPDNDWWIDQVMEMQRVNHKHNNELVDCEDGFLTVRHAKSDLEEMARSCPQFLAVVVAAEDVDNNDVDDASSEDPSKKNWPKVIIGYNLTVDRKTLEECPNLSKLYKIFFDMADDVMRDDEQQEEEHQEATEAKESSEGTDSTRSEGTEEAAEGSLRSRAAESPDDGSSLPTPTSISSSTSSSSSSLKDMNWVLGAQVCVSKDYRRRGLLQALYDKQFEEMVTQRQNGIDAIVTAVDHANTPSLKAHSKAKFMTLKAYDKGGKDNTGWSLIIRR